VVEIPDEQCPWREVLRDFAEPLFIMYENKNYGTWSLKAIPVGHELYIARRDLPESWAGKQGKDLEEVTGVPGSVFCHRARFLAVATTKEAILQLAQIALNQ
jgi:uncharacterized UPF0160 family protein